MSNYAVFLEHHAKPGRRDDVFAVWSAHMPGAIEANPDHLAYWYGFDLADDDVIRVFQLYTDADSGARFLEQPAYLAYLAAVEPLLDGLPVVGLANPMWTTRS